MSNSGASGQADSGITSVSSTTQAPSRTEPSVSSAVVTACSSSGEHQGLAPRTPLVDGESDGEVAVGSDDGVHEPAVWRRPSRRPHQAWGARRGRDGRQRSGRSGTPRAVPTVPGRSMWSSASLAPVFPARSMAARAHWSCRTASQRSRTPSCRWGWRPASPSRS